MNFTKAQMQIYKMSTFCGGSIANLCVSMLLKGHRDIDFLKEKVNMLFELNDGLRIQLYETSDGVKQRVLDYEKQDIKVLYFSDYEEFNNYATEYAKIPFPDNGYLCEILIVILPDRYGIIPKLHHLIGDAWTLALIGTQFNSLLSGTVPPAYSFAEYISKEKYYLQSKRYKNDAEFFETKLEHFNTPIYLSDIESNSFISDRKTAIIDKDFTDKIKLFADENGISVFSFFLSVFSLYISGVKDNIESLCIGTTVLNRSGTEEKNTIGSFINMVPVFIELQNDGNFIENAENVESSILSTLRHQRYNYQSALDNLRDKGIALKKPYDVVFNYQNIKVLGDFEESGWFHNGMQLESMQIHIEDRDNAGVFKIHYDYQTEKFSEKDISRLHSHLCNLIENVLKAPNKKISDLEMISADEKQKILHDFNNTDHHYSIPDNSTIFSLFEKTAKENKEKICIKTAKKSITFGELLNISEYIDTEIRNITRGKKSVIAVIAERSVEMYASIYGIIRGGNAYLPIDPDYPKDRIDYILNNSGAAAVVTQGKFTHLAGNLPCVNMTDLISKTDVTECMFPCAAKPNDTAYVIYTSGSTGNPKGAKISHKSAVNRILWMHDKYPLGSEDVILQKTPYTFDVSVWEIFWWGFCGGTLAACAPGEHFLPAKILDEVYNNKVTHLHFVPSVFEIFINYLEAHKNECNKFNCVKYVFLSGEALSANLVQRFYKLYDYGKVTLHNLYGPTECAVDVTYYDCVPTDIDPVPIGMPIYNTQMYVVDKHLKPVPMGVTGELCIAGMNVGQGYLNNPELTADKFVDNPFGGGKLYKTGDLAFWIENGQLIFCGRKDGQIKLNGQRIEIGEIETTISEVDCVESAAVIVKNVNSKDILVAFYTGKQTAETEIKEACLKTLPRYMVPNVFVHLDALPLNQSGKLNRKALSEYTVDIRPTYEQDEPINEVEKLICKIFKSVLETDNIGRNSDFFESGGTSLSMISALSETALERISPSEFMRNPTPAKLAELLHKNSKKAFDFLEPLYISKCSEQVLLLIPYAGGGPEAYSSFVNSLKSKKKQPSIYFLRYLHSIQECKKAAQEISTVLAEKEIFVYSHCVGSAIALQILKHFEKLGKPAKHYIAGASIPPLRPTGKNIWNLVPNRILKTVLSKAGAKLDGLPDESLDTLFKQFRKDTDFANIGYFEFKENITTPVSLVINRKDMFTINYNQAVRSWKKYATDINKIYFINSNTHYFQSDNAEELIKILQRII